MDIEKMDQRSHEKGRDHCSNVYCAQDAAKRYPANQGKKDSEDHAGQIADDAADRKRDTVLLFRPDQGDGIIG